MNEEEIANLVTRLSADNTELQQSMDMALRDIEDTMRNIEETVAKSGQQVEASSVALGTAIGLGIAKAIEWGTSKAKEFGRAVINAWSEAETVAVRLDSVLASNGRNVAKVSKAYYEYAAGIQAVTTMGDEAVISILTTAESYNLTGKAAIKATNDAIGLAEISGGHANSMMRMTAAMAKGDTHTAMMFARMIPQLRGIKDEQKFLAEYSKLVAAGFDAAKASTDTYAGALKQMREVLGDLYEDFGKIVAGALKPLYVAIKDGLLWFRGFSDASRGIIVAIGGITVALSALTAGVAALMMVGGPITLTFLAITGAVAALTAALVFVEEQTGMFSQIWSDLQPVIAEVGQGLKDMADSFLKDLGAALDALRPYLQILALGFRSQFVPAVKQAIVITKELLGNLNPLPASLRLVASGLNLFGGASMKQMGDAMKQAEQLKRIMNKGNKLEEGVEITGHGEAKKNMMELRKSTVSLTTSLQEQIATYGMSSRAASIYKLEMAGASEEELKAARIAAEKLATMERSTALTREIVGMVTSTQQGTEAIRDQIDQLDALRNANSTTTRARQDALQIAKDEAEIRKLIDKGARESEVTALRQSQKAAREAKKELDLTQEGLDLMEKYKTPAQKLADQQEHLMEVFQAGKIDLETYNKALKDLKTQADKGFGEKIDASAVGSAEGLAKILETRNRLRAMADKGVGGVPNGLGGPVLAGNEKPGTGTTVAQTARDRTDKTLEYLKELVELARADAERETFEVTAAGLV